MKRFQVWKPRNKGVGFLLHPKFWCFQKHAFLAHLYFIFSRKIFCYSQISRPTVSFFKSLFEKDVYYI